MRENGEHKTLEEDAVSPLTAIVSHKNNFPNYVVTYAGNVSCMPQRSFSLFIYLFIL